MKLLFCPSRLIVLVLSTGLLLVSFPGEARSEQVPAQFFDIGAEFISVLAARRESDALLNAYKENNQDARTNVRFRIDTSRPDTSSGNLLANFSAVVVFTPEPDIAVTGIPAAGPEQPLFDFEASSGIPDGFISVVDRSGQTVAARDSWTLSGPLSGDLIGAFVPESFELKLSKDGDAHVGTSILPAPLENYDTATFKLTFREGTASRIESLEWDITDLQISAVPIPGAFVLFAIPVALLLKLRRPS